VLGLCLCAVGAVRAATESPAPQIHLHVFLSSTCPHCDAVQQPALKRLAQQLGCTIVPHYHDVDSEDEYKRLVALERRLGDTGNDLPVVVLGDRILGGNKEIESDLNGLLARYAATGLPDIVVPTVAEADAMLRAGAQAAGRVRLAYFEAPGCRACARVDRMLTLARERHPGLEVRRFAVTSAADRVLLEALCERAGVAESHRLLVPAVFAGSKALVQKDITDEALEGLLASAGAGGQAPWEVSAEERTAAGQRLWERSRSLSLAAVTAGGLVDGVNPCAFATIVFLVCCLAGMGRSRIQILSVGAAFTFGVFLAYLLMGIGLGEVLQRVDALPAASRIVSIAIVAAVFVFALLSFRDWTLAVRGRPKEMALKLPDRLRMRINAQISRRLHGPYLAAGALGLGGTVSLVELVCTGQVYVPLIRYMTSVSADRMRALGLLVVYDVAFIVPLVIVFLAAYIGVSSERLQGFFKRNLALSKLMLGLFFMGLGFLLLRIEFAPL
jgi:glutaredoxin